MWFEGVTTPKEFFGVIRDAILAEGSWTMVSSKVGNTTADDGYVFNSKGSSGLDEIFIGFKNAYHTGSWHSGPQFFVAEKYVPSATANTNGVFTTFLNESFYMHENASWGGASEDRMPLKYFISVNADRVIIGAMNHYVYDAVRYRPLIYLGLMKRYSYERDSGAVVIACTNGDVNNNYNWMRVVKDNRGNRNVRYNMDNVPLDSFYMPSKSEHQFMAFPITLQSDLAIEGVRGELDGMLIVRHYGSAYGRNMIRDGKVIVNGEEYQAITKLYYSQSRHNNFGPSSIDYTLLIKKA